MEKTYTLNNGITVPQIGYGTYKSAEKDVLITAIKSGYRYFDTASFYETERALGQAIIDSKIDREEIQIASKVWLDEMGYKETKEALGRTLSRLQTDYLDMYLIHWPRLAGDENWKQTDIDTWKAMEEMVEEGKIKSIGLSNFLPHHLDNLLQNCKIRPAVDQLELHPGYLQEYAYTNCLNENIIPQAWSPLGRKVVTENPYIIEVANKYGRTPAQICLRFLLQRGIMPIVKTVTESRMIENLDVYDFELSKEDMQIIACMPQAAWSGEHPDFASPTLKSNFNQ